MIKKKYKLTDETIKVDRITLYRIRALKDFGDVKKGDFSGFVESERNLSHDDNCWVGDEAWVYENAYVYENAKVYEDAEFYNNAKVGGNAIVAGKTAFYGSDAILR
ncbi:MULTISPECIES: hypothetical protein [unclassified Bartonella]|uniref:hypothetical protein n=1 Tax=unclassified Bartonella TaxID=2645622 RepID=UPI0035CF6D4A